MQNQHNTTNCVLLLQQQFRLQYDLEKYIRIEEITLLSLKSMKYPDNPAIQATISDIEKNMQFVIGSLKDAVANNDCIIKQFRQCINLSYSQ